MKAKRYTVSSKDIGWVCEGLRLLLSELSNSLNDTTHGDSSDEDWNEYDKIEKLYKRLGGTET